MLWLGDSGQLPHQANLPANCSTKMQKRHIAANCIEAAILAACCSSFFMVIAISLFNERAYTAIALRALDVLVALWRGCALAFINW